MDGRARKLTVEERREAVIDVLAQAALGLALARLRNSRAVPRIPRKPEGSKSLLHPQNNACMSTRAPAMGAGAKNPISWR
jgi:hypothetical protein